MGVGSARNASGPRLQDGLSAAGSGGRAGSPVGGWGEEFGQEVDGGPVTARHAWA